jgi:signal transduction histidine kinase
MEPEAERLKAIRTIEEATELLEDILELSRQGKSREPERTMDVSVLVEDMVEDYAETGAPVTLISTQRSLAVCRPVLMRRALRNLIDNAASYGGAARVTVEHGAGQVSIHIDDDGPGMTDEALRKATDPFYRGEASRNRDTGGAGLGLTLCEAIARAHGGSLTLQNRASNGLRATVKLPLAAPQGAAAPAPPAR